MSTPENNDVAQDELLRLATAAHYLSTYCLHDHHDICRLECKTCKAPCRCACHGSSASAGEPPTRERGAITHRTSADADREYEFYADPANREPVGPPVRRHYRPFSDLVRKVDEQPEDPKPGSAPPAEVYGWGVWHRDDEEWIGFGATNGLAAELIPQGPGYEHLVLQPVVVHITVIAEDETDG